MPFSTSVFKKETVEHLKNNFDSSSTILDVGPGRGYYSELLFNHFNNLDGVEIFERYISDYRLKDKYRNVFCEDILNFEFDFYDIILMGDVLEHIEEQQAIDLIKKLYPKCKELIIAIPFESKQGEWGGNIYETHLQPDITHNSFLLKYEGFKTLGVQYDYGVYIKK